MKHVPLIAGLLTGLVLAFLLKETPVGMGVLAIAGALGGALSWTAPKGGERVYWGFLAITILIVVLGVMGVDMHRLVIIFPLVLALGYFVARLAGRFSGQRKDLPA